MSRVACQTWGMPRILLYRVLFKTSLDSKNRQTTKNNETQKAFEEQGIRSEEWISRILEIPEDLAPQRRRLGEGAGKRASAALGLGWAHAEIEIGS